MQGKKSRKCIFFPHVFNDICFQNYRKQKLVGKWVNLQQINTTKQSRSLSLLSNMGTMLTYVLYLVAILVFGITKQCVSKDILVQTKVGNFVGIEDSILLDNRIKTVTKFLGIPYAETTAGVNRFEKPIPKKVFNGTFYAKTFGPSCWSMYSDKNSQGLSEDCLSLNIYVPGSLDNTQTQMSVMVWIYGGSFVYGSSKRYKAEALSTFGDVIVVTVNYRMEMFGFLRSNDGRLIGNQGLWDQHLAFKWVHDNIASFHGDRDNITIFGESSGGVSVMLQALYPGNKGLFQRVISESGTAFEYWSVYGPNARKIISKLSCTQGDRIMCLKQKSALEIQSVQWLVNYGPVVDGDFLVEMPTDIVFGNNSKSAEARKFFASLDVLTGMCRYDGALYILDIWPFNELKSKNNVTMTRKLFSDTVIPKLVDDLYNIKNARTKMAVVDAIKFEYTDWTDPDNADKRLANAIRMTSEATFYAAVIKTLHGHSTFNNGSSYFFEFAVNTTTHLWSSPPSWAPGKRNELFFSPQKMFILPLKSQKRPSSTLFIYKIQVNPIHTILKYGNYYDFMDR